MTTPIASLVFTNSHFKSFHQKIIISDDFYIKNRHDTSFDSKLFGKASVMIKFNTGNRCGFTKNHFRQPNPLSLEVQSRIPKFIRQMQAEIQSNGIPGLNLRAERDEAVRALTIKLLDFTDLFTGKIGIATKDGWLAFGWQKIMAGIPWLSESRLWVALNDLQNFGLFDSNQRLADPRYITKDPAKKSGYAVSDKGFTDAFWTAFRQTKRWKHEAEAKAKRTAEKAAKAGKTLQDFYKKTWCNTRKISVKQMTAAGITKTEQATLGAATPSSAPTGPSANAVKMMLMDKLIKLGFKDAFARAQKLFDEFGASALVNTEQFVS